MRGNGRKIRTATGRGSRTVLTAFAVLLLGVAGSQAGMAASGKTSGKPSGREGQETLASPGGDYAACMKLAREKPKTGYDRAGEWSAFGGGVPAEHCRATALIGLNEPEAAATLLEELATKGRESAAVKVGLLRQAAQARLMAGQAPQALAVLDAAVAVLPEDPEVREDRAVVRIDFGEPWDAIDDLNAVLDRVPDRVSALVLRAAAYRRLESYDLAKVDVSRVLALQPNNLDALVETGLLARLGGDNVAARSAWMSVLRLAPESDAAEVARGNLAKMDIRKD